MIGKGGERRLCECVMCSVQSVMCNAHLKQYQNSARSDYAKVSMNSFVVVVWVGVFVCLSVGQSVSWRTREFGLGGK